jgi:PAS domain-containing protein
MTKPRISYAGTRQLKVLLVGGTAQEFVDLRRLLARTSEGKLQFEQAASPADVLNRFEKGSYDLLLCSSKSTDNAAFQLLRQVRQHYSGVPLVFLSEPATKASLQVAIQAAANHSAAQNHPVEEGTALAGLSDFDMHSAEQQHLESEETLRKLWRSVEQMADTLIIMDRSGVMEYVNPAFEALTGYSRQEAIGQTLGILKSEKNQASFTKRCGIRFSPATCSAEL